MPAHVHPFAHLVALARGRLVDGERPVTIARDWSRTVDDANDDVVKLLPGQTAGLVEAFDGPAVMLAALVFLHALKAHDKRAARRAAREE
jgi:hypothetical protein